MKRRAVAGYLACIVVNCNPETFVRVASRPGLENQIVPDNPERFKVGRAPGAFPFLFKPALSLCGIGAGGGPIFSFGHGAFKRRNAG